MEKNYQSNWEKPKQWGWLTRVGVRVAISFSPLVRWGLVVEFILRLNQRERVWDQGSTTHRFVVSQTTVTAAFLGAIGEVKCNTALGLQRRAQDTLISALLFCSPDIYLFIYFNFWNTNTGNAYKAIITIRFTGCFCLFAVFVLFVLLCFFPFCLLLEQPREDGRQGRQILKVCTWSVQ